MNRQACLLVRLYPRAWRERYGEELVALLQEMDTRPGDLLNLLGGAGLAHAAAWKERLLMTASIRTASGVLLVGFVLLVTLLVAAGRLAEGPVELLLLVTPAVAVPSMGVLAGSYPATAPRANRITLLIGRVSGVAVFAIALTSVIWSSANPAAIEPFAPAVYAMVAALTGLALWFVLNGWLGLRGAMPVGLGLLGILLGGLTAVVLLSSFAGVQALLSRPAFTQVMSVVTPLWLLSLVIWLAWTAIWLWSRRAAAPNGNPQTS